MYSVYGVLTTSRPEYTPSLHSTDKETEASDTIRKGPSWYSSLGADMESRPLASPTLESRDRQLQAECGLQTTFSKNSVPKFKIGRL